jgi:hypothetical protein
MGIVKNLFVKTKQTIYTFFYFQVYQDTLLVKLEPWDLTKTYIQLI